MSDEYRAKIFKSGNSVALRLPKALGLKEGSEMILRQEAGQYSLRAADPKPVRIDLSGVYGSCPGIAPLDDKAALGGPRNLDWQGKRLDRD